MRTAVRVVQVLVGLLFVVSGLVKANDPIGLSYKMQEFFELWSEGFAKGSLLHTALAVLHNASLGLSIAMISLEIVAGAALWLGWKKKSILWLLLALIVFFTFLTGYAYLSGKFTNCGCFGDCLPITPLASFVKDLALLLLIVFLLVGHRYIAPVFSAAARTFSLVAVLLFSLALQWYVLTYLPLADCLPFKEGANLPAQMKPPPGSVPDSFAIRFVYEKEGRQYEFAPENLPADFTTYKFIDRKQTLVRKGNADAAIKGFTLTNDTKDETTGNTVDSAAFLLAQPQAFLLFVLDWSNPSWLAEATAAMTAARQRGIPVAVVSANFREAQAAFAGAGISGVQFFNTDFTIVRTVARTNPTALLLQQGRVVEKWSRRGLGNAQQFFSSKK